MKVLLDENIPHRLRAEILGHDVYTVSYMGWTSVQNGELLKLASEHDFHALVTTDKGFPYQHSLSELLISVIIIRVTDNSLPAIRPFVPSILRELNSLNPPRFIII